LSRGGNGYVQAQDVDCPPPIEPRWQWARSWTPRRNSDPWPSRGRPPALAFGSGFCSVSNQFLDPRSCDLLLGGLRTGKIGSLPVSLLYFQLEYFLRHAQRDYAADIGTIPHRLREHNLEYSRSRAISEMLPIDADVVFEFDAGSQKSDITFKAYFQHPGFE